MKRKLVDTDQLLQDEAYFEKLQRWQLRIGFQLRKVALTPGLFISEFCPIPGSQPIGHRTTKGPAERGRKGYIRTLFLCGLRRLRMLVDFRLGQLAERAVGIFFLLERSIEKFDRILIPKLARPGLERAVS